MSGMYVGQLDSKHPQGYYPGWSPNRDPTSKWCVAPALPAHITVP